MPKPTLKTTGAPPAQEGQFASPGSTPLLWGESRGTATLGEAKLGDSPRGHSRAARPLAQLLTAGHWSWHCFLPRCRAGAASITNPCASLLTSDK